MNNLALATLQKARSACVGYFGYGKLQPLEGATKTSPIAWRVEPNRLLDLHLQRGSFIQIKALKEITDRYESLLRESTKSRDERLNRLERVVSAMKAETTALQNENRSLKVVLKEYLEPKRSAEDRPDSNFPQRALGMEKPDEFLLLLSDSLYRLSSRIFSGPGRMSYAGITKAMREASTSSAAVSMLNRFENERNRFKVILDLTSSLRSLLALEKSRLQETPRENLESKSAMPTADTNEIETVPQQDCNALNLRVNDCLEPKDISTRPSILRRRRQRLSVTSRKHNSPNLSNTIDPIAGRRAYLCRPMPFPGRRRRAQGVRSTGSKEREGSSSSEELP